MNLKFLGNESYGGWMVDTEGLSSESIVYSFGVGFDISWDLAMIENFGCNVFAFDPTETSKNWLASQDLPEKFSFEQVGLSTFDGVQDFFLPLKQGKPDYSTVKRSGSSVQFPVKRLETLMKMRGHSRIDVLKIDIEGSEFAVLPKIAHLPIAQILVEMHPNMYGSGWKGLRKLLGRYKFHRATSALSRNGFVCAHRNENDYTFIKSA